MMNYGLLEVRIHSQEPKGHGMLEVGTPMAPFQGVTIRIMMIKGVYVEPPLVFHVITILNAQNSNRNPEPYVV